MVLTVYEGLLLALELRARAYGSVRNSRLAQAGVATTAYINGKDKLGNFVSQCALSASRRCDVERDAAYNEFDCYVSMRT